MRRVGELVECSESSYGVCLGEEADVARKRARIARHIDDPLEAPRERDASFVYTSPGGVDKQRGESIEDQRGIAGGGATAAGGAKVDASVEEPPVC